MTAPTWTDDPCLNGHSDVFAQGACAGCDRPIVHGGLVVCGQAMVMLGTWFAPTSTDRRVAATCPSPAGDGMPPARYHVPACARGRCGSCGVELVALGAIPDAVVEAVWWFELTNGEGPS